MTDYDAKSELQIYLQRAREALVWKLEGAGEYDIRRPMTPTGTNLLGLVKHVASVEAGYLGDTFHRPSPEPLPWAADAASDNADMWATAEQSRADIVGLYHRVWAHSDATIESLPLDALGRVPWWPAERAGTSLHRILVHVISETERHAGHADILRETIDGSAGIRRGSTNLPTNDEQWWTDYRAELEAAARAAQAARVAQPADETERSATQES